MLTGEEQSQAVPLCNLSILFQQARHSRPGTGQGRGWATLSVLGRQHFTWEPFRLLVRIFALGPAF
jgi:hypothetical protein